MVRRKMMDRGFKAAKGLHKDEENHAGKESCEISHLRISPNDFAPTSYIFQQASRIPKKTRQFLRLKWSDTVAALLTRQAQLTIKHDPGACLMSNQDRTGAKIFN